MSFIKKVLSPRSSLDNDDRAGFAMSPRSPSFNEMSMGAVEEHEAYTAAKNDPDFMNSPQVANPSAIQPPPVGSPLGSNKRGVWQSVFNPGRNFHSNMKSVGNQYWDAVDQKEHHPSIWDHVLLSERHRSFDALDKDKDGFLSSDDLHKALGRSEDVKQLIAAADANGDGKIDRSEFHELLRNSTVSR